MSSGCNVRLGTHLHLVPGLDSGTRTTFAAKLFGFLYPIYTFCNIMQFGIDQDWFIEQHIFIYTGYTVLNSVTILKDELERMMEEVVLDYSKVVSQHMP
jgi:hypothetical protein